MPGMHGEVHVNRAIQHADLIIGGGPALRRPRDRQHRGFAPACEDRAHRARPDRDRQERAGRRAAGRRCRPDSARPLARALAAAVPATGWREEIGRLVRPRVRAVLGRPLAPRRSWRSIDDERRRSLHHRGRRGAAPDVGGQAVPLPAAQHPHHLRRPGHDGFRRAGRDRACTWRAPGAGVGDLGRRRLPDEHAGDGHHGAGRPARQDGDLQQRLPRHGAPMAAVLPWPPLLGDARSGARTT